MKVICLAATLSTCLASVVIGALTPPPQSHVLRFFGSSIDAAEPFALDLGGSFTLEAWARVDSISDSFLILLASSGEGRWEAGIGLSSDGEWSVESYFGSARGGSVVAGRWTHLAGRFTPGSVDLFVDGQRLVSQPLVERVEIPEAFVWPGQYYMGSLRQVRIWNAPLSDAEIVQYAEQLPFSGGLTARCLVADGRRGDGWFCRASS